METNRRPASVDALLAALRHSATSSRRDDGAPRHQSGAEGQSEDKPFIIFAGEMTTSSQTDGTPTSRGRIFEGLSCCKNMQDMFLALKRTMAHLISHNDSVLVEKKVLYWDDERFNNGRTWHYAYGPPISTTTGGLHRAFENSIQEVHQDPFYNPESYFRITIRSYGHGQQGPNPEATAHTQQRRDMTGSSGDPEVASKKHKPAQKTDDIGTNKTRKKKNLKRRIRMHTENKADPIAKRDGFRVTARDAKIRYLKQAILEKELKLRKRVRKMRRALEAGRAGKLAQAKKKDNAKLNKGSFSGDWAAQYCRRRGLQSQS